MNPSSVRPGRGEDPTQQALDLAGFLDSCSLTEALDREAYRVLADCRDKLARLAGRIEQAGPR
jgi:hypothetical protein